MAGAICNDICRTKLVARECSSKAHVGSVYSLSLSERTIQIVYEVN